MLTILRYSPWTIYVRHKKHPYNYLSHRKLQGRSNWAHLWVNKHFEVHVSIFSMHVFNNIGVSVFIVCFMQLAVGPCINEQVSNRLYARLVFHICTNNTITGTERSWKKKRPQAISAYDSGDQKRSKIAWMETQWYWTLILSCELTNEMQPGAGADGLGIVY